MARMPREGGGSAVFAMDTAGRWASAGQAGPKRVRVGPAGSVQKDRIRFVFFNLFLMQK
jgi:hypothetical protein